MTIQEGDPKMFLTVDGMDLNFVEGVPLMEAGLENVAIITLGTEANFALNKVARNGYEAVGSTFIEESKKAITANQIRIVEDAAERGFDFAVESGLIKAALAELVYAESVGYQIRITLTPPTGADTILVYSRNGENWVYQQSNIPLQTL
jgi:hypothetical protein